MILKGQAAVENFQWRKNSVLQSLGSTQAILASRSGWPELRVSRASVPPFLLSRTLTLNVDTPLPTPPNSLSPNGWLALSKIEGMFYKA